MGQGNLFNRKWVVDGGQSPHDDDLPTIGGTFEFINGKKITVKCSPDINRPGSAADWRTLTLERGHDPEVFVGTVMIGGFAKVTMLKYTKGAGRKPGKDNISCDFHDLITPAGMPAPNTHDGTWHGTDD